MSSGDGAVAAANLVCYSCHLWSGTKFSAQDTQQPFIWAWNCGQTFDASELTFDAHLKMHAHHAGNGGWGRFWMDMPASANKRGQFAPSFPPIRPGVDAVGATEALVGTNTMLMGALGAGAIAAVAALVVVMRSSQAREACWVLFWSWTCCARRAGGSRGIRKGK